MQETDQDSLFVSELTRAQSKMRIYLAKLLANSPSTDDVLQECNKVLWVKSSDWKPETIFLKWAYRVCFFQVKAYFRNQSREKLVFNDELFDLLGRRNPMILPPKKEKEAMNKCLDKSIHMSVQSFTGKIPGRDERRATCQARRTST